MIIQFLLWPEEHSGLHQLEGNYVLYGQPLLSAAEDHMNKGYVAKSMPREVRRMEGTKLHDFKKLY